VDWLREFQFLIGRLKTRTEPGFFFFFRKVSIPYRQAKNFNPPAKNQRELFWFQFLIGRLKTEVR